MLILIVEKISGNSSSPTEQLARGADFTIMLFFPTRLNNIQVILAIEVSYFSKCNQCSINH